jgi:hypothetical protein
MAARPTTQNGVALLVLMVVVVLGVSAFLVSIAKYLDPVTLDRNRNAEVLQQAKTALIGHVATQVLDLSNDFPGRLPCPEAPGTAGGTSEGLKAGTCAPSFPVNKNIGRLPWRTLGIDKLVDAANEPLWYAVSPDWANNGSTPPPINSGTPGQFAVDGAGDVVAVIIAPGRPLNTNPGANQVAAGCAARLQVRNDRAHNTAFANAPNLLDYLECQNATPLDGTFGVAVVDNAVNEASNDQLITITARDIMSAIQGPLAERLQRTVAPMLSEFSDRWVSGNKFLPYALPFVPPEDNTPVSQHCGPLAPGPQQREGLLPVAGNPLAGDCSSSWTGLGVSGSGIRNDGCTTNGATGRVTCTFTYYYTSGLAAFLGLGSGPSVTATIQAVAPRAAASFRDPLQPADITGTSGPATTMSTAFTVSPQTDGNVGLQLNATVNGANLCTDTPLLSLVCEVLALIPILGMTSDTAQVEFPQLAEPVLQGSKLSTEALNGQAPPFNLLTPASGNPHYWFMQNQWYRYTYYAVSESASAAGPAGTNLTIDGFPADYGNANDKRFVLALMGPAVTGQVRAPAATLAQYVEGANNDTSASPRVFAYQVFKVSGNDRVATCPYKDGATGPTLCD